MCVGPIERPLGIPRIECDRTFLRWQQYSQSKNLPLTRVSIAFAIDPYKSAIERAPGENKWFSGLRSIQKRRPSTSSLGQSRRFRPRRVGSACALMAARDSGPMTRTRCATNDIALYSITSSAVASSDLRPRAARTKGIISLPAAPARRRSPPDRARFCRPCLSAPGRRRGEEERRP